MSARPHRPLRSGLALAFVGCIAAIGFAQGELQELIDVNGEPYDVMGASVDVEGNVAIVGAHEGNRGEGQVFIYRYNGFTWQFETELLNPSPDNNDQFGFSVAIEGDRAVVGAPFDDTQKGDAGLVFIYERIAGTWTRVATLQSPSAESNHLGGSVDLEGDVVVAGAPADDSGPGGNAGLVLIYVMPVTGWADTSSAFELRPSDATTSDLLGMSVAMDGDTVVAGAPDRRDASNGRGCLYVFERPAGGWASVAQSAILEMSTHADDARLGLTCAIDGNTIVGGGRDEGVGHGAVYVYDEPAGGWADMTETQRLSSARSGQIHYGESVALAGGNLFVGIPVVSPGGICAAYTLSGGTWGSEVELVPATIGSGDVFGSSVALSADFAFIGAPFREPNGDDLRGAAFVYVLDPPTVAFTPYGTGPMTLAGTASGPCDLDLTIDIGGAQGNSPLGILAIAAASAPGLNGGGVLLWVDPASMLLVPLPAYDGAGHQQLLATVSPTIPAGVTLFLQAFAARSPRGLDYSHGLELTITP